MSRISTIYALLDARDPKVFREGGCHVFADALSKRFGYVTHGIKKTTKMYSHVYCTGHSAAVDIDGIRSEEDILEHWQQYPGMFSLDDSLRLREQVDCEKLFEADYAITGLLSEKKFVALASSFANEYIASNLSKYEGA